MIKKKKKACFLFNLLSLSKWECLLKKIKKRINVCFRFVPSKRFISRQFAWLYSAYIQLKNTAIEPQDKAGRFTLTLFFKKNKK